jgi:phage gpG-like protein
MKGLQLSGPKTVQWSNGATPVPTLHSYLEQAEQLKVIQRQHWPKALNSLLRTVGETTKEIAKEEVIGRTTLLPAMLGANKATPAWTELQDATIERKGDNRILLETGNLRDSIDFTVNRAAKKVDIGTDVEYGAVHEYGAPLKNIPPRPFLTPSLIMACDKLYAKQERVLHRVLNNERAF